MHLSINNLVSGLQLEDVAVIYFKFDRVVGHHLAYVALKIGAILKKKMAAILKFHFWILTQRCFCLLISNLTVVEQVSFFQTNNKLENCCLILDIDCTTRIFGVYDPNFLL